MDQYVTGAVIKKLREERRMTQAGLAELLNVSDKAVSKWETGRGYPDITMLEPLSEALGVSVTELLAGESVRNTNRSFNMTRLRFHVCPVCGNVITSTGEAVISCCGITLPAPEPEEADAAHEPRIEKAEDEYYVTFDHAMTKDHYLSFVCGVRDDGCETVKLYPEGPAEARFKIRRTRYIYWYCNRHGLFRMRPR
ncbi:MAG: helix-turn-helix domain-containing protein [Clostridia bacterium]|nr:helix-turn-helix domain-containing protein [Clostridia bacterium]